MVLLSGVPVQLYSNCGVFWMICSSLPSSPVGTASWICQPQGHRSGLLWDIQLAGLKTLGLHYPVWFLRAQERPFWPQLEDPVTLIPDVPAEHVPEHCLPWTLAWLVIAVLPPQSHDVLGRAEI